MTETTASSSSTTKTFAVLGNANHVIFRKTLRTLLSVGRIPTFVMEDTASPAMARKTAWYQSMYDIAVERKQKEEEKKDGEEEIVLPSIADLAARYSIPHYTVANINHPDAIALMKQHPDVDVYILANTRIVKPVVLAMPRVTSMNPHYAYLPTKDPAHQAPHPSGYIRGALPFMYALLADAPMGITLHHVQPTIDTGDIIVSTTLPIAKGEDVSDLIVNVVDYTAKLIVIGLREWDGKSVGIRQDETLILEENRECKRAPKGSEAMEEFVQKVTDKLKEGTYSWYSC